MFQMEFELETDFSLCYKCPIVSKVILKNIGRKIPWIHNRGICY